MTTATLSAIYVKTTMITVLASFSTALYVWSSALEAVGLSNLILFTSLVGSALGAVYQDPGVPRKRLFTLVLIYTVIGAALAIIIPEILGWDWAKRVAPLFALLVSFGLHDPGIKNRLIKRARKELDGDLP